MSPAVPAPAHEVTISMDRATLDALVGSGYWLYAFAAVESADAAGQPLVWMRTQAYSALTYVGWTDALEAYTAPGVVVAGRRIRPGFLAPIEPGQLLRVVQRTGVGDVSGEGGRAGAVSVLNSTTTQLVWGVSRQGEEVSAPVCAFPLYGGALQAVVPLDRVLLLFSPAAAAVGTVAATATGPGVLLDLAGAAERAVRFDVNAGWEWGEQSWGEAVPANTKLGPLLVRQAP